jgi:hypothetical protein
MTDTISIGGKKYPLTPMNPHEATAAMFVLTPYIRPLALDIDPLDKLAALFEKIQEENPVDLFRMLAYMLHVDAEELIHEDVKGSELVHALAECFSVNSLPDLINMAFSMRIVEIGWGDDVRAS